MSPKQVFFTWLFPGLRGADIITLIQVWVGSALTIGGVALMDRYLGSPMDLPLIIAPFGASAVLVFGAPASPLAKPRNVIGSHVLSALVGVFFAQNFGTCVPLAAACAVATAIVLMLLTGTLHPPGGATALIAVIGGPQISHLGYLFALVPCFTGSLIVVVAALICNAAGLRCRLLGACVARDTRILTRPAALRRSVHLLNQLHKHH